jgi:tRNA-splicing ligase RtcB
MRVPVRVFADDELLSQLTRDHSVEQLLNVSTLPGVTQYAFGMPDMHEGYGFPVGGVAATLRPDGVISPGGIGFDINCGVRLLASSIRVETVRDLLPILLHELSRSVPTGYGRHGRLSLERSALDALLNGGVPELIARLGFGLPEDTSFIEAGGCMPAADASSVSDRARQRGSDQIGTLGGGNHFLEVQRVDEIFDSVTAEIFGLFHGQLTVLIHTGSRGLGHQVCTDYVREMDGQLGRFGLTLPDRQLACAPFSSPVGQRYFAAMSAAANFAWCNRQALTHRCREVFARVLGARSDGGLRLVYDVAHNIAKVERYGERELCVHRKGATRAFGPSNPEVPRRYRTEGQPVFIPGSMGTASFVLAGTDAAAEVSLNSCCHGAGRLMSRTAARRSVQGHELRAKLESLGILVECASNAELAEEAPTAYKDVERVVDVVERAGIARKVARLRPVGVLKG